jgi:hypothetical protein
MTASERPERPDDEVERARVRAAIEALKAFRQTMPAIPLEELLAGRHEGHRY